MTHYKAELHEKKITKDENGKPEIVHLKFFVPDKTEICEIDLSGNKVDDDGNLTQNGKEEARNHLRRMIHTPEDNSIAEEEKNLEF